MATCPAGHDSATDDYCDECGLAINSAATGSMSVGSTPARPPEQASGAPTVGVCVNCGNPRDGRFCEACGHDAALPASDSRGSGPTSGPRNRPAALPLPLPTNGWTAVVRADRSWYDEVRRREGPDAADVEFPRYCPDRPFELTGNQMAIGRRSRTRGTNPEIDLSGPPLDPGVSAQHALLLARPDGGWEVVDLGSTNGTSVGDSTDLIRAHVPVQLADGDRIRLGAWTTITVQRG